MSHIPGTNCIGIELKLTDRCNLACFHCMNSDSPNKGDALNIDLFLSRFQSWLDESTRSGTRITEVRMTGGEPLICAEAILRIARSMSAVEVSCGVNTNGILLSPKMAASMKQSGVGVVKISMDSLNADTLRKMRGRHFSPGTLLNAVHSAVEHDLKVILRFTLCRLNVAELLPCLQFAREAKVWKFQVKPLILAGRGRSSEASLSETSLQTAFRALAGATGTDDDFLEILCFPHSLPYGLQSRSCGSLNKLYIDTKMDVTTCNYIYGQAPLGNLAQDSFEKIQRERQRMLERAKTSDSHAFLPGCPLFETGGGRYETSRGH